MLSARPSSPKCIFIAWVLAWATVVYLPSLLIALFSISPIASGGNLLLDTVEVADEVSPAAKLTYAMLFGIFVMSVRLAAAGRGLLINVLIGVVSITLVVALLPEYWSRGFGVGMNGTRFAPLPTAIYLIGGSASGIVFTLSEAKCISRSQATTRDQSFDD